MLNGLNCRLSTGLGCCSEVRFVGRFHLYLYATGFLIPVDVCCNRIEGPLHIE